MSRSPRCQVRVAVADVIESANAEPSNEGSTLPDVCEIGRAIARDDAAEAAKMCRDVCGHVMVRTGRKHDFTSGCVRLANEIEDVRFVGKSRRVWPNPFGKLSLQVCLAPQQPEWNAQRNERMVLDEENERLPEEIGCDEGAIEIDAKRPTGHVAR